MLTAKETLSSLDLNRPPSLPIRAHRGPTIRTLGWRTEGLLRMLENVLEVGGGYAGYSKSSGVTIIADGTPAAAIRIGRTMNADTGLGVLRYADAGYPLAGKAGSAAHKRGDFESLQPFHPHGGS